MPEILWPIDVVIRVVRPEAPGGFVIINASDLKPEDVLYEEEEKPQVEKVKNHERQARL